MTAGDSFIFDYHFMWDHLKDPGGFDIARIVFNDMISLRKLGLNGMISCQAQRAFFPTGLGMNLMARALWNSDADFEEETRQYFSTAFGGDADKAADYLRRLSALFDSVYIRGEKETVNREIANTYASIPQFINDFKRTIEENISESKHQNPTIRRMWGYLLLHAEICERLSRVFMNKALGNSAELHKAMKLVEEYACAHEPELHEVFDLYEFLLVIKKAIE